MSSGRAPGPPESGWKILYEGAFEAWRRVSDPPTDDEIRVLEWIESCKHSGPPGSAIVASVVSDVFVVQVPGTKVTATYLYVEYEYLIIVKEFS